MSAKSLRECAHCGNAFVAWNCKVARGEGLFCSRACVIASRKSTPERDAARFWSKVDRKGPDGFHSQTGANLGPCWIWRGWLGKPDGYGRFDVRYEGSRQGDRRRCKALAHRRTYEALVGPVPDDLQLDHLCRVRECCNPAHLEPVTQSVNVARGAAHDVVGAICRAKTHCPAGHPYDEKNTYVITQANGSPNRMCRACKRDYMRRKRAAKRASAA